MASIINASTSGVGGVITTADNSGDLNIQSGGSTKIAVTSAGANIVGTLTVNGAAPAYGKVLQVVSASSTTYAATTSTSWVTTGLSTSITPTSSTSKVLVIVSMPLFISSSTSGTGQFTVFRGTVAGTNLGNATSGFGYIQVVGATGMGSTQSCNYLDSPATISATTYTVGFQSSISSSTVYCIDGSTKAY